MREKLSWRLTGFSLDGDRTMGNYTTLSSSTREDGTMITTWPSREEWAKERRTPYCGRFPRTSNSLAEYATPREIAALEADLRERSKQLGRRMRELSGDRASDVIRNLKSDRSSVQWALALVAQGELPHHLTTFSEAEDILAPFHERYEAAKSELHDCTLREIERTPIDDNAWNAELHQRAKAEQSKKRSGLASHLTV